MTQTGKLITIDPTEKGHAMAGKYSTPALVIPGHIVENPRISAFEKFLMGYILSMSTKGHLDISLMNLCYYVGSSYPTIRKSIKRLEKEGLIKIQSVREGKGGGIRLKLTQKVAAAVSAAILTFGNVSGAAINPFIASGLVDKAQITGTNSERTDDNLSIMRQKKHRGAAGIGPNPKQDNIYQLTGTDNQPFSDRIPGKSAVQFL